VSGLLQYLRMCDIIYVMKEGRVLERGTHQQLMESGNDYANIVNTYYRRPPGKGVSPSSSSSSSSFFMDFWTLH